MKILVLGSRGNIGSFITRSLSENHQVIGLNMDLLDIRDKDKVILTMTRLCPDFIVQASGISDIDFCENNETESYETNALGTLNIASTCNLLNIPIVYISSGYVYGDYTENHAYNEEDICNPINMYGKSKLAGEKLIQTICKKYFILRTSWCFGGSKCYVKKILQNKNSSIFMSSTDVVNPTYLKDLTFAINKLIATDSYGIYNCVNNGSVPKNEFISLVFHTIGIKKDILPIPEDTKKIIAPRPTYCNLDICKIETTLNIKMPSWEESLNNYLTKICL